MGNAVHAAIGENFRSKIETKRDLPPLGIRAIYLEAWDQLVGPPAAASLRSPRSSATMKNRPS
jgi:hypothetical protein